MEVHMNSKAIVSAVMAACMAMSGLAVAQQDKDVRSDEANRLEHMGRSPGGARPERPRDADRGDRNDAYRGDRDDHRDDRGRRSPPPRYEVNRGPGAGPDHNFYRGGRLPPQYRGYQYVVEDWRGHRLTPPPRGYHWVQTGADYVLVAVATGVIASILLSH
jgi:Ni/Co efflux regulator RcnB